MRVHGQVRQRVGADGVQGAAAVPGDHLDVPVEQHPVSRLRPVAVAQRVPAVMRLRVLQHRHHVRRGRVGLDAHVGPLVQRPGIGAAPAHPALLVRRPGAQRQREAGEGRARLPVVGAVDAARLPDQRLHLGRRPGPRHLQVVPGHADDRRSQRAVRRGARGARGARGRRPGRLVHRQQMSRNARRRRHLGDRAAGEGESGHRSAGRQAHQRGRPPPRRLRRYLPWSGRVLRMACTCGSPGLPAFWNSTLAFCAATGLAPGIHRW